MWSDFVPSLIYLEVLMKPEEKMIWFKRKRYGWGWTPCTWQGWMVVVIYIVGLLKIIQNLLPNSSASSPTQFFIAIITWTVILIVVSYRTGEKPRWQWGEDDDNYSGDSK